MVSSRIAPTPSGYLHVGNAVNFALTWLLVRKDNGTLRLRIDDLDTIRCRPEYIQDIFYTLDWLDITWDEGPHSPYQHEQHFAQHFFEPRYTALTEQLMATGLVYACRCSRSIAKAEACRCRELHLPLNTPDTALRIATPPPCPVTIPDSYTGHITIDLHDAMPHFIIRRRDGIASYQLASLADDTAHNINLIVRGSDLLNSTAAQLYLAQLTGNHSFAQTRFYHHPLITDALGIKLSKSAGSASLKAWRDTNRRPEEFYKLLSALLGWKQLAASLPEMLAMVKDGAGLDIVGGDDVNVMM